MKMQRMRSSRTLYQNEDADKEVEQPDNFQIQSLPDEVIGMRSNDKSCWCDFLIVALERVGCTFPDAKRVQDLSNVAIAPDRLTVDRLEDIPNTNASSVARSVRLD